MREYMRLSETIHEGKHYEVFVGVGSKDDELPKYLVRNKEFDVIEFESESLYMAKGWVAYFDPKLDEPIPVMTEDVEDPDGNILNFPKPN